MKYLTTPYFLPFMVELRLKYKSLCVGLLLPIQTVWVGMESLILGAVTIGEGAVVAARSVVTKDVPPRSLVAGVPAKVVKFL